MFIILISMSKNIVILFGVCYNNQSKCFYHFIICLGELNLDQYNDRQNDYENTAAGSDRPNDGAQPYRNKEGYQPSFFRFTKVKTNRHNASDTPAASEAPVEQPGVPEPIQTEPAEQETSVMSPAEQICADAARTVDEGAEQVFEEPSQTDEEPEQPEEAPAQPDETPAQPEEAPTQPEEAPEQPDETPEQPDETPAQAEEAPEQPDETPAQAEEKPEQINEAPEQPIPYMPPAERLVQYLDCNYKLIPAGTDINEVNRIYLAALRYGVDWGISTIIVPVSEELADYLCNDGNGRPLDKERVRAERRIMLLQTNDAAGEAIVESLYHQKTEVMARRGVNIKSFENSDAQGGAVNCFSSFISKGQTICDLIVAQIPVKNPWEVFAWLPVGGINAAPSDNELIAVSKLWYDLCGAVPAVIGYGVVEYFVPRGKPSRETAQEIAKGHFAVCHERVLRLTKSRTLSELADTLAKSCVWYLGWR